MPLPKKLDSKSQLRRDKFVKFVNIVFRFMEPVRFGLLPSTVPESALQKGFSTNKGKKLCFVPISAVTATRFSIPTKRVIRNRRIVCPAIIVRGVRTFRPVPSPRHYPQEYALISVGIIACVPALTKRDIRNRRTVCPAIIVRGVRISSNIETSGDCAEYHSVPDSFGFFPLLTRRALCVTGKSSCNPLKTMVEWHCV